MDASSNFQDSLPVSSDKLMTKLDEWKIYYICHNHIPLKTVTDSKRIQSQFLGPKSGGGHIKNLYLRDKKKCNILLVAEQDQVIDLNLLKEKLGTGRLSFGSEARLLENLGVRPGAVSPFAMITGVKRDVRLFFDKKLRKCVRIYAHPLVNDRTLELSVKDLLRFFEKIGVAPKWLEL